MPTQMQSDQAQPLIRSDSEAMLFLVLSLYEFQGLPFLHVCYILYVLHSRNPTVISGLKSYLGKDTYHPDSPDIAEILICHTVRREGL